MINKEILNKVFNKFDHKLDINKDIYEFLNHQNGFSIFALIFNKIFQSQPPFAKIIKEKIFQLPVINLCFNNILANLWR